MGCRCYHKVSASHDPVMIFLLCFLIPLMKCKESHFVIAGRPEAYELRQLINEHGLHYRSHGCLDPYLHYFVTDRSGRELFDLYDLFLTIPWVASVEPQLQFRVEKRIPVSYVARKSVNFIELPDDDEYDLAAKRHAEKLWKALSYNDPHSHYMWQLLNDGNRKSGRLSGLDLNVYPVYLANITGKNVVGIVVDDALDTTHEDLRPNINLNFNADLVNITRKDARGTDERMKKVNDHGTEVAGLFAAVANNSKCAFGVAYNATLGGIRLLGDKVTDFMVGEALTLFSDTANIYISSWGPTDDGRTLRSPGKYVRMALKKTGTAGNRGRGSIFVFPSGNGGAAGDNCGADGFINHPSVIAVGAVSENGLPPVYAESCAAISVAVPVGGSQDKMTFRHEISARKLFVPTTKINNMCTGSFVGTSASNPMAAGVIALALEANPSLRPRDVAAILALSGRIPSASASDFSINGGGLLVSHTYGSGLLNAVRMVKLAKIWKPVGRRRLCLLHQGDWSRKPAEDRSFKRKIFPGRTTQFAFIFDNATCDVETLEVVRVGMQWTSVHRGSIEVSLTSPSGQEARLISARPLDHFNGFSEMIWKSLIHTGESCYGRWIVKIRDNGRRENFRPIKGRSSGAIRFIGIEMMGTSKNQSAFEQNKEEILKHWHQVQVDARKHNRRTKLSPKDVANLYNKERWSVLEEGMS